MFTGIIEEIGEVESLKRGARSFTLKVKAHKVLEATLIGDSISTNGVCLTVTRMGDGWYEADVMPESVERTALSDLKPGSRVNLERALTLQRRLGGHMVAGHVDATGRVVDLRQDDNALWVTIEAPQSVMRYVVKKGSIAINGVSLTVANLSERTLSVSLIPHTQGVTTLHSLKIGERVNLESDMIVKYVERLMGKSPEEGSLTIDFLREHGF